MSRRRLVLTLWAFVVFGLAVRCFAAAIVGDARGCAIGVVPVLVDINRASVAELEALPGIGRLRAEAIVLHRVRHGPFRAVQELDRVDGLGEITVEALRAFAEVGPAGGQLRKR